MDHEKIKEDIISSLEVLNGSDIKFLNQILTLTITYTEKKRDD